MHPADDPMTAAIWIIGICAAVYLLFRFSVVLAWRWSVRPTHIDIAEVEKRARELRRLDPEVHQKTST
jgi:hypothetical protein